MKIIKYLYIAFGTLFLWLGLIGVLVPILPTTPFLLLTAYCYNKGSIKFNNWFIGTKLYKKYLYDFVTTQSMTFKNKVSILLFADLLLLYPLMVIQNILFRYLILILILIKYYYFIFKIKTIQ